VADSPCWSIQPMPRAPSPRYDLHVPLGYRLGFSAPVLAQKSMPLFATIVRERADALFVAPDSFFIGSRVAICDLDGTRQDSSDLFRS
jgi:hypothetical protein